MSPDYDQAHVGVYRVLEAVLGSTAVPPGTKGTMYSIVDSLRSSLRPAEDALRAERISIAIHKLETAIRERDEAATRKARDELKLLAVAWLDSRISYGQRASPYSMPPMIITSSGYGFPTPLFHCA